MKENRFRQMTIEELVIEAFQRWNEKDIAKVIRLEWYMCDMNGVQLYKNFDDIL